MYEACVILPVASALLFGPGVLSVHTGFPLAFSLLWIAWITHLLPPEVYHWMPGEGGTSVLLEVTNLVLVTDALQYVMHRAGHTAWRGSHGVHHRHTHPTARDAFVTGLVDAVLQLLVPIYASLWFLRPCRVATSAFGVGYGLWLQWIHCAPASAPSDTDVPMALRFVTPAYHHVHHVRPNKHYGHVLCIWDWLGGTEDEARGHAPRLPAARPATYPVTRALPRVDPGAT